MKHKISGTPLPQRGNCNYWKTTAKKMQKPLPQGQPKYKIKIVHYCNRCKRGTKHRLICERCHK